MAAWQSNRTLGGLRAGGCREAVPAHRRVSCFARPSRRAEGRPQAAQVNRSGRLKGKTMVRRAVRNFNGKTDILRQRDGRAVSHVWGFTLLGLSRSVALRGRASL